MPRTRDAARIAIVGYGAMGRRVHAALREQRPRGATLAVLSRHASPDDLAALAPDTVCTRFDTLLAWRPTLVVECATHEAVAGYVPALLAQGIDVVVASIGALSQEPLRRKLAEASARGGGELIPVAGGVGGLDALSAARIAGLSSVRYVGTKPPLAWTGTPAEERFDLAGLDRSTTIFLGHAADAARLYPKNANVTAAIALAGIGFERTTVRLVADPAATRNVHEIQAEGAFGSMSIEIRNQPLPDNPRTSLLAALSIEATVRKRVEGVAL